jgi:hypothetical protein
MLAPLSESHDLEIWFGESSWPAFRVPEGLLVDFRLYNHDEHPALGFYPERLAEMGIDDDTILAAAENNGFVLLDSVVE